MKWWSHGEVIGQKPTAFVGESRGATLIRWAGQFVDLRAGEIRGLGAGDFTIDELKDNDPCFGLT